VNAAALTWCLPRSLLPFDAPAAAARADRRDEGRAGRIRGALAAPCSRPGPR
jgi:hypothetical protein